MYKEGYDLDLVFKGLLRPAMIMGVPLVLFIAITGLFIWLAIISSTLFGLLPTFIILVLWVPVILLMRQAVKHDENIQQILTMKLKFLKHKQNKKFFGNKTYIGNKYKSLKKELPSVSIIGLDKNTSIEELLPYSSQLTDCIVKTHDYDLLTTWKVEGVPFEVENIDKINSYVDLLNMIFKQTSTKKISFYVHSTRYSAIDDLPFSYKDEYLHEFATEYYKSFNKDSLYRNDIYITVVYTPINSKMQRESFRKINIENRREEIKHFIQEFNEIVNRYEAILKPFNLTKLTTYEENNIKYSEQLEFYSYLMSGKFQKTRVLQAPLNEYMTATLQNVQFGKDTFLLNYIDSSKKFGRIIEFKDYTPYTYPGILNILMYLDIHYTISQSFIPIQKNKAVEALSVQKNQLESSEDHAKTQIDEIDIALNDLTAGEISFGEYHYVLTIFADTKKDVIDKANLAIAELINVGFIATLADLALPASYFSQFPANFAYRVRTGKISSRNFASFISLHNFPKGKKERNCWGDAITMLKTPNKQSYFLNLHETRSDNDFGKEYLGNTFIVGMSGGGKTALMTFLMNMMMKYQDPKTFPKELEETKKKTTIIFYDKDYGAMGNILAIGGKYIIINNGEASGFNPFMTEATDKNINNIQRLMKMLVTRNGIILSIKDEEELFRAINFIMYEIDKEHRTYPISLLVEQITKEIDDDNSLTKRLMLWTKGNKYGWVFDNEKDNLIFDEEHSVFGIDGTEFLEDEDVRDPIIKYLNWRIDALIDGRRFIKQYDEVWYYIQHKANADDVRNNLKTIRKRNGILMLSTQSPEDIAKSDIARPIIEQSATTIFLANEKAVKEDYIKLGCTEEEFETIRKFKPFEYKFLLKNAKESVVINLDLSKMPTEYIKILSTAIAYKEQTEAIFSKKEISQKEKVNQLKQLYKG